MTKDIAILSFAAAGLLYAVMGGGCGGPVGWPADVRQDSARADGLGPADFQRDQWPVTDVRLDLAAGWSYSARMPADTPQANVYAADPACTVLGADGCDPQVLGVRKLPDPAGMTLAWVRFELVDLGTSRVLDTDLRDHDDGALLGRANELWQRLEPGGPAVTVRLRAVPVFMFLGEADGGMQGGYALTPDGYFRGRGSESRTHTVALTVDGAVIFDGEVVE